MRVATKAAVAADGTIAGTSELTFDGINDNAYRGYFSRIRPEDRRRLFESVVKRVVAGARLTDLAQAIGSASGATRGDLERLGDAISRTDGGNYRLADPVFGLWVRWRSPAGAAVPMSVVGNEAEKAVAASGVAASLLKVEKIDEIMKFGVMSTPALVVDGEVKCSGRIPQVPEIVSWLTTAAAKNG